MKVTLPLMLISLLFTGILYGKNIKQLERREEL